MPTGSPEPAGNDGARRGRLIVVCLVLARHDENAAVHVKHVDVVAVEGAQHVLADDLVGRPAGRPSRRRGRRCGPSPGSSGFISWADSSTATPCSVRSTRSAGRRSPARCADVEVGERLVQQEQLGPADEGVGDQGPLLLASRELAHPGVGKGRAHRRLRASRRQLAPPARGQRDTETVPVDAEGHEVARPQGHVWVEDDLLGDVADGPVAPLARLVPKTAPCQRRASAARGSPGTASSCPPRWTR